MPDSARKAGLQMISIDLMHRLLGRPCDAGGLRSSSSFKQYLIHCGSDADCCQGQQQQNRFDTERGGARFISLGLPDLLLAFFCRHSGKSSERDR